MPGPLVQRPDNIRLAMLGMVDGNGHPYSWSAIINGRYDAEVMADCGFPVIPQYLGAEPPENLGISGVQVTHVWCDEPADSVKVAKAAMIPNVVRHAEDVIGEVDAVVIATDRGWEHVDRAKPFIDAGLPMFIDKPLCDREDHLRQFIAWRDAGAKLLSTSCMRYCREFRELAGHIAEVGEPRLMTMTMCKTWERYGIHALEGVYPLLTPGRWLSVANTGTKDSNIVHIRHADGVDVVIGCVADMYGAFGRLNVYGTKGALAAGFKDTFYAFKAQLTAFVEYLRTGQLPMPFDETVELIKIIVAGIRSREQSGRTVSLDEI